MQSLKHEHLLVIRRQLGPVVRSPEAATAGGGGHGLSVSLLERFIQRNQEEAGGLMAQGLAPATGHPPVVFQQAAQQSTILPNGVIA